jgi:hypothetical protein
VQYINYIIQGRSYPYDPCGRTFMTLPVRYTNPEYDDLVTNIDLLIKNISEKVGYIFIIFHHFSYTVVCRSFMFQFNIDTLLGRILVRKLFGWSAVNCINVNKLWYSTNILSLGINIAMQQLVSDRSVVFSGYSKSIDGCLKYFFWKKKWICKETKRLF